MVTVSDDVLGLFREAAGATPPVLFLFPYLLVLLPIFTSPYPISTVLYLPLSSSPPLIYLSPSLTSLVQLGGLRSDVSSPRGSGSEPQSPTHFYYYFDF